MHLLTGISMFFGILFVALFASQTMYARPIPEWMYSQWKNPKSEDSDADNYSYNPRIRRLSDQRMAELETLLALEKIKGVAIPVGLGKVDPAALGRKRRAMEDSVSEKPMRGGLVMQNVISGTVDTTLADLIRLSLLDVNTQEDLRLPDDLIANFTSE